jgi:MFS family permease
VSFASVLQPVTTALGDPEKLPWVVGSWSLASAVSFSLAGPLSDVFERRWPMLVGEALTIIGCIVTAVAQNVPTVIAGETLIGMVTSIIFVEYAGEPEMLPNQRRTGIVIPW